MSLDQVYGNLERCFIVHYMKPEHTTQTIKFMLSHREMLDGLHREEIKRTEGNVPFGQFVRGIYASYN